MIAERFYWLSITLLAILLFSPVVSAQNQQNKLFGEANEAYSRGEYDQAIKKYEQITQTAGYAPGVLYNLANSYALSGRPGKAIVNYQRALRLTPNDSDITGNLQLVKKENGLFPHEPSRAEWFFDHLRLNQWTVLVLLTLVFFTVYLTAAMKYRFSKQLTLIAGAFCLIFLSLGTAGTIFNAKRYNPSVIIDPEAKLLLSPFPASASIGTLPEGRLVYRQKSHGNYSYVADEMDRQGWIDASHIEEVCKLIKPIEQ